MNRHGALRGGERGQNILEFALIMPVLLVIVFIIVDLALALDRWIVISNAAEEAARTGITGAEAPEIMQRAIDTSQGLLDDDEASVDVRWDDANGNGRGDRGEAVIVEVTYDYNLVTPIAPLLGLVGGGLGPLRLHSCADMRLDGGVESIVAGEDCE